MEKQDEYNFSLQRTKIMKDLAAFPVLLFGGKTQLVYLLGRIYCQNKTDKLPNNELCQLFNETRLEKINYDIFCNQNGKPAHSETIDALFDK